MARWRVTSSTLLMLLASAMLLAAMPLPAQAATPLDECTIPPRLVATVPMIEPDGVNYGAFVHDRVWFGGGIYQPDGTFLRPVPDNGSIRGEVNEFSQEVISHADVEWGLAVRGGDGMRVFSPDGDLIAEVPAEYVSQAIYDDGLIVAFEAVQRGSDPLRAFAVEPDGTVTQLDVEPTYENDRVAAAADGNVFFIAAEGSLTRLGLDGRARSRIEDSLGQGFGYVFAAHGYVYAASYQVGDDPGELVVLRPDGTVVHRVALPAGAIELRPTERGIAYAITGLELNEADGQQSLDQTFRRFVSLSPTGHQLGTLGSDSDWSVEDRILRAHGRFLVVQEIVDTVEDDENQLYYTTSRIRLFTADGTPVATSSTLDHSYYSLGRPTGRLLLVDDVDPQVIQFRTLAGAPVSSHRFTGGVFETHQVVTTDHRYVWVATETVWDQETYDSERRAHIFDLGDCAGVPSTGTFVDDDVTVFEADIEWLADRGITRSCDPARGSVRFCPDDAVTRGQMAAFLNRALDLPAAANQPFDDATGSVFARDIAALAAAGITTGCAPDRFCPDDPVTRGQMAAFLNRGVD